jgi:hypothetical protein
VGLCLQKIENVVRLSNPELFLTVKVVDIDIHGDGLNVPGVIASTLQMIRD